MSPTRARFVTACQQLLALGVVVVALVPATRVVSLDVVGVQPGQTSGRPSVGVSDGAALSAYERAARPRTCDRTSSRDKSRERRLASARRGCGPSASLAPGHPLGEGDRLETGRVRSGHQHQ
jgi:hypothetical protein